MAISDLYSTGLHKQNLGHFSTIVRLALLDNEVDEDEQKLLKRLSKKLNISKKEFTNILKDPGKHPVNPPVSYEDRLARLYDLAKMMFLDKNPTIDKTSIIHRIIVGLGFPVKNAIVIADEAIKFFIEEPDVDDFKVAIKKVNVLHKDE